MQPATERVDGTSTAAFVEGEDMVVLSAAKIGEQLTPSSIVGMASASRYGFGALMEGQPVEENMCETGTAALRSAMDDLSRLEARRCRAISELDLSTLGSLLADDLTHTHVTGATQDRDSYFAGLRARPRLTTPGQLSVRVFGAVAVMSGRLTNTFTKPDGSATSSEIHALRVWRSTGTGSWQLLAFAASGPLTPRPPAEEGNRSGISESRSSDGGIP